MGDEVTPLLMTQFYELLDPDLRGQPESQNPQAALRQARLGLPAEVKDTTSG